MTRFFKVFLITGLCVAALVFALSLQKGKVGSSVSDSYVEDSDGYRQSDELIYPYVLSKNPYRYKGHSGLLVTTLIQLVTADGRLGSQVPMPGGGLRFEKMIDERTAVYTVLTGTYEVTPDTEIAVELPDNDPPTSTKLWRIYVVGTDDFENGAGATIQLAKIKFEGYAVPPTPPPPEHGQLPNLSAPATPTSDVIPEPSSSAEATSDQRMPVEHLNSDSIPMDPSDQKVQIGEPNTRINPLLSSVPANGSSVSLSILSNMQSTSVTPYVEELMRAVHKQFLALVPQETYPPQSERGETRIRFAIASDGSLVSMQLEGTPSDDILAKAAWTSIRSMRYPPLPATFQGSELVLSMRFVSNK